MATLPDDPDDGRVCRYGRGVTPVQIGESVEGEKLVFQEGDLLVCTNSHVAHIVFLGTLCNTKMQHWGPPVGRLRLWTKVGACRTHGEYAVAVRGLGYDICRACYRGMVRYRINMIGQSQ